MTMKIAVIRTRFGAKSTHGVLFVDGKFFGYTIEDIVRMPFEKIKSVTAIKSGSYWVNMAYSAHFGKNKIKVREVANFDGILIHEGNTALDSSGCILVGFGISMSGITRSKDAIVALEEIVKQAEARGEKISLHVCDSIFQLYELNEHCPISLVEVEKHCW